MLEAAIRMYIRCREKMRLRHLFIAIGILVSLAVVFTAVIQIGVLTTPPLKCVECGNEIIDSIAYPLEDGYVCEHCFVFNFD